MAELTPIYDLMLLLHTSSEDERRAEILAEAEQTIIDGGGAIELRQEWGVRALAFEIDHIRDADYHLMQFSGPAAMLDTLDHNLKITDGVLRHRIIKVTSGTPPPPDPPGANVPAAETADAAA